MSLNIQTFFDPATFTATYLISDDETGSAAVIDPVLDYEPRGARLSTASADRVLRTVRGQGLELIHILETHAHADHLSAADYLRRKTGAKVVIGAEITQVQKAFVPLFEAGDVVPDGRQFDRLVREGDELSLGSLKIKVLHTPGHTPADVTYLVDDAAFVGDTLFMPDYGTARADFPGGDAATLYRSIRKILALPDDTRIFVGHDYLPEGRGEHRWETTVAAQKAGNVHVRDGVDEAAFVDLRAARDRTLQPPVLILPSLQVNIRAGALPPPSEGGRTFLKIPVTQEGDAP
jgi:glyoxylase-like metal-dependent hydrolase (beta-lactamase superfamily II)